MRNVHCSNKTITAVLLFALGAFMCFCACGKDTVTDSPSGVTVSELAGTEYGVAVLSENGSLTLFGHILFDEIEGETISGQWCMETWGEQTEFPTLAVNTGEAFPEKTNLLSYSGRVFGDMIILELLIPDSETSLGVMFDKQDGEELFGTATLLPGKGFNGSIKAIKSAQAAE
jgi:hypothetical protein